MFWKNKNKEKQELENKISKAKDELSNELKSLVDLKDAKLKQMKELLDRKTEEAKVNAQLASAQADLTQTQRITLALKENQINVLKAALLGDEKISLDNNQSLTEQQIKTLIDDALDQKLKEQIIFGETEIPTVQYPDEESDKKVEKLQTEPVIDSTLDEDTQNPDNVNNLSDLIDDDDDIDEDDETDEDDN